MPTPKDTQKALHNQLNYYAHLIYALMQKSDNWGDAGQYQVDASFTRHLLNLPPETSLTYTHTTHFQTLVQTHQKALNLSEKTTETLQKELDDFTLTLNDKTYTIHTIPDLNKHLQDIGSTWRIQGGMYGYALEFMVGEGPQETFGDYTVYYLETEHLRSPNTIVAMAAVIGETEIFVRKEALATIYHLKCGQALESLHWGSFMNAPEHTLSQKIKTKVLSLYNITTQETLLSAQETFIADMKETVMYHELGHGVIQHHLLPIDIATFAEASKLFGEHIITALLELLAEIAPKKDTFTGPLENIHTLSKTNPKRAERMYWMYASDTWFFDTPDEYMYLYSDLMALTLSTKAYERPDYLDKVLTCLTAIVTSLKTTLDLPDPTDITSYSDKTQYWSDTFDKINTEKTKLPAIESILETAKTNTLNTLYQHITKTQEPYNRNDVIERYLTSLQ